MHALSEGFRPVRSHDVQHRGAIDYMDDFVAVRVALPGAFAGKFAGEDGAVRQGANLAKARSRSAAGVSEVRPRNVVSLASLTLEIHDGEHLFLRWAMTLA
jgi:hypothetical protein